jgi:hypothetical protein
MSIIHEIVERLGGHIEKRRPRVPNVTQEHTLAAIGATFATPSAKNLSTI